MNIFEGFRKRHLKPFKRRYLAPWQTVTYAGIDVSYKPHLDGGGTRFGQAFIPLLRRRGMPRQGRVFEWCAGPGFIGFSILGHRLSESLCLADINPEAVAACLRTVHRNRLTGRVEAYRSDNLRSIPQSERWDLVVSNPPHFVDAYAGDIRSYDPDWRIHQEFFRTISPFLKPGGVIILQENNRGSTAETFRPMIEEAGFSVVFVEGGMPECTKENHYYFLGIMRRGDAPPAWARPA